MPGQIKTYRGIELGSVSLNIAIPGEELRLLESVYERTRRQPVPVLIDVFEGLKRDFPERNGVLRTGGGRNLAANILEIDMGISIDEEHAN